MGQIRIVGKAEHDYKPDLCNVDLVFQCKKRTADLASKYVNDQCEKLLAELVEKEFDLDNIKITLDYVDSETEYDYRGRSESNSKEIQYEAKRAIRLTVPADQRILNHIRDIIENGYKNITFSRKFFLSNEASLKKDLVKEAIADSKAQAEFLAESMGQKITGVDTANLSGREDYPEDIDIRMMKKCCCAPSERPLSDKLKADTIMLSAEVNIVWLIDSKN